MCTLYGMETTHDEVVIGSKDDPPNVDGTCYDWHIFGRVIEVA